MFRRKKKDDEELCMEEKLANVMDMNEFIEDNKDVIFYFTKYKRIFTPYEEEKKFSDESVFEDSIHGYIRGAVDLGYDYLLEVKIVFIDFDGCIEESGLTEYIHLGDCKMTVYEHPEDGVE